MAIYRFSKSLKTIKVKRHMAFAPTCVDETYYRSLTNWVDWAWNLHPCLLCITEVPLVCQFFCWFLGKLSKLIYTFKAFPLSLALFIKVIWSGNRSVRFSQSIELIYTFTLLTFSFIWYALALFISSNTH